MNATGLRGLRDLVLVGLGFCSGAGLVRARLPWAGETQFRVKLAHVEASGDDYDALYLGSSRTLRGLDPLRIDAELARAGHSQRSFNLGLRGCEVFEQDFVLRHVLARRPARLRWVFLEGGAIGTTLERRQPFDEDSTAVHARSVQWHTWPTTLGVLGCLAPLPLPLPRKLELALGHLELFALRFTALGRGPELLASPPDLPPNRRLARGLASAGFEENERDKRSSSAPELERYRLDPTAWAAELARVEAENARAVELDELDADFFRRQEALAARAGVRLVYYTAPSFEGSPELCTLAEHGVVSKLLHFNDPARFPELFALEARFDEGHVNARGAALFSARFAEGVKELLAED